MGFRTKSLKERLFSRTIFVILVSPLPGISICFYEPKMLGRSSNEISSNWLGAHLPEKRNYISKSSRVSVGLT